MENYNIANAFKELKDVLDDPKLDDIKNKIILKESIQKDNTLDESAKIIIDIGDYKPWSGAISTFNKINDAGKLDDLDEYIEELYPDGLTETELNDILWFDSDDVLEALGLSDEEADEEEKTESLDEDTVKQGNHWVNKGEEGTHGKFKTKKAADAQRKAMFANGYKEGLEDAELKHYKVTMTSISKKDEKELGIKGLKVNYEFFAKDEDDARRQARKFDNTKRIVSIEEIKEEPKEESLEEGKCVNINDSKQVEEGKEFLENKEDESDVEQIVDVDADDVTDLKKSYIGDVVLECPVCHTKLYKTPEDLVKSDKVDEEGKALYNIKGECPHCGVTEEGFKLLGQVAKYEPEQTEKPESEEESQPQPAEEQPTEKPELEPKPELDNQEEKVPTEVPAEEEKPEKEPANESLKEDMDTLDYEEFEAISFDPETGEKKDSDSQFFSDEKEAIDFAEKNNYDQVACYTYEKDKIEPVNVYTVWEKSVTDIDESKFDKLISDHLKEQYNNFVAFKTESGKIDRKNNIVLEGKATFQDREKAVKFIIECKQNKGKANLTVKTEDLVKARKPISMIGVIKDNNLICENIEK